jgi:hypothetical protein
MGCFDVCREGTYIKLSSVLLMLASFAFSGVVSSTFSIRPQHLKG